MAKRKWINAAFCKECDHELTRDDIYRTDGVCPYCGHQVKNSILTQHYDKQYYEHEVQILPTLRVEKRKWWEVWKPKFVHRKLANPPVVTRVYKGEEDEHPEHEINVQRAKLDKEGL